MKFLLVLFTLSYFCDAYRILLVFQTPVKSHIILGDAIVKHLLDAGHQITYLTPFPKKDTPENLTQIDIYDATRVFPAYIYHLGDIIDGKIDLEDGSKLFATTLEMSKLIFKSDDVQKLLNDQNQKFDLIILEWMFLETYAGLSAVFDCPFIWFSTTLPTWPIIRITDEIPNPAYSSNIVSKSVPPFGFYERVKGLFNMLLYCSFDTLVGNKQQARLYEEIFTPIVEKKGRKLPSFDVLYLNASLVLGNYHPPMGPANRLPQSYKSIGGFHIDDEIVPLPQDLQTLMDNTKDGIIYFSMGSNLKTTDMPEKLKIDLLKKLGEVNRTILWKNDDIEIAKITPKNVHISKWYPQQSVLAHPNCILFITHGGLLSLTESVHYGVPVIGIPVYGDQFLNVAHAVSTGFGKRVYLSYNLADDLKNAIDDALSSSTLMDNVKRLSLIYHDRLVSPGKELVHWVEHVVRTGGAPQLRSPALMVPWYQKLYLDLTALILAVLFSVGYLVKYLLLLCKNKPIAAKKTN